MAACIFCFSTLVGIINASYYIYYPCSSNLFGSLFPKSTPKSVLFVVNLPQIIDGFISYISISIVSTVVFYFGILMIPIVVSEFTLGHAQTHYIADSSFREYNRLILEYRSLSIMFIAINQVFGRFLFPLQTCVTILFVACSYVLIRHREQMTQTEIILLGLWINSALFGWSLILMLGGYVYSNGQKCLGSWKRHSWKSDVEQKLMKQFVKSCQPIRICFGTMFVIRRVTVMIYIRGLNRGLIRALLALKNKF